MGVAMEPILARQLDYYSIIVDTFTNKKARKAIFKTLKMKLSNNYFVPYYMC